MKEIADQLRRVENLTRTSGAEFFGNKCKRDREWWVLGKASFLLSTREPQTPVYAEATDPPNPDFKVYSEVGEFRANIEITEVIEAGRRRHSEIKERLSDRTLNPKSLHVIDDPFISFRRVISEKSQKPYGSGCWLIIFFSIPRLQMPGHFEIPWEQLIFDEVRSWASTELTPQISSSPYERVFVLDSNGTTLVSISPDFAVFERLPNNPSA